MSIKKFTIEDSATLLEAISQIDINREGFLLVLSSDNKMVGILNDGDIRRLLINGSSPSDNIQFNKKFKRLMVDDSFDKLCDLFKLDKISFLPILNGYGELVNVIKKKQFHSILLYGETLDLSQDFTEKHVLDIGFEIYNRPWGFYKSTLLSDYVQSKVITIFPYSELSLQEHKRREEHWVIVKGKGKVILGESSIDVYPGKYIYVPKGCKHQIINDTGENIVFTEVQLGDYFGEDDIIRYSDKYGRA